MRRPCPCLRKKSVERSWSAAEIEAGGLTSAKQTLAEATAGNPLGPSVIRCQGQCVASIERRDASSSEHTSGAGLLLVQAFFAPQPDKAKPAGHEQHLPNTTSVGLACATGGLPQV